MIHASLRSLAHDITHPARLIPALSSALVVGLLIIVIQLSLASLIFSGPLASFAPTAAGLTLFGGFVMCFVVALGSSYPSSIALPQDAPAAVMATVPTGIAAALGGGADQQQALRSVFDVPRASRSGYSCCRTADRLPSGPARPGPLPWAVAR